MESKEVIEFRQMQFGGKPKPTYKQLEAENKKLVKLVNIQAKDDGLWFEAKTAPEAYLQSELRKLHAVIEPTQTKDGG